MIQKLADYIIRPKRRKYSLTSDLGGDSFMIDNTFYCERMDFEIKNRRNLVLKCSLFNRSIDSDRQYPLILYCHGNSGNRTESYDTVCWMLRMNILVLSFDFAGCGLSEGSHISLGYYEKDDIEDVYEFVKKQYDFVDQRRIGIWGRSMGAVSTLLFAASHPSICLLVLDSPFEDLATLLHEYIDRYKIVSKIAGKYIYKNLKSKIMEQCGFDIEQVSPIAVLNKCTMPIMFLHGANDTIVTIQHSKNLFEHYNGEKVFVEIDEGHNDSRSERVLENISLFIVDKFTSNKPRGPRKMTIKISEDSLQIDHEDGRKEKIDGSYKPQTLVKLSEVVQNSGDDSDDDNATRAETIECSENERRPFVRRNKRHMAFIKSEIKKQEENKEQEQEQDQDQDQERSEKMRRTRNKSRTSVDLTNLLARKRTINRKVTLNAANLKDMVVSDCDAEQVENMVTIFQEINEDEISVADVVLSPESTPHNRRPNLSMNIGPRMKNDAHFKRILTMGEADIATEDLADTTELESKDPLHLSITCATGTKFEQLRKK